MFFIQTQKNLLIFCCTFAQRFSGFALWAQSFSRRPKCPICQVFPGRANLRKEAWKREIPEKR